jgi:arsenate reductase
MCPSKAKKKKILVLCTHNSARSQIAEGLFRHLAGDKFDVESAGSSPCGVNPFVIKVLTQEGIDASGQYSKNVSSFKNEKFDYVITVCANAEKSCPLFIGTYEKLHWPREDPAKTQGSEEEIICAFCKTRDKLKTLISEFLKGK